MYRQVGRHAVQAVLFAYKSGHKFHSLEQVPPKKEELYRRSLEESQQSERSTALNIAIIHHGSQCVSVYEIQNNQMTTHCIVKACERFEVGVRSLINASLSLLSNLNEERQCQ